MNSNPTAREKEVWRFPDRYIGSVKSPDGRVLRANREIRDAFRGHFRDRFACYPDLPLQEFRNYLADFPCLGADEAASCKVVISKCEDRDALERVGLNKSPGLDGLPYEVYLKLPHMFVPILSDMFNHCFAQGAIPGSVTKGVITLLKKGGRYVWEGLDDYRPITLLNTELKILALLPLPRARRLALQQSLSRLLWAGGRPMVHRQVCIQRTRSWGLGMPDLESHWLAERLANLGRSLTEDAVWRRKASRTFPRLQSDPKAEGRRRPMGEVLFVCECRTALRNLLGSSDLSHPQKELYRELVCSASDPLREQHG